MRKKGLRKKLKNIDMEEERERNRSFNDDQIKAYM